MSNKANSLGYVIGRSTSEDAYSIWLFDPDAKDLLSPVTSGFSYDRRNSLVWIGGYLLEWGPSRNAIGSPYYEYRLFQFDPKSRDPLSAPALQHGQWSKAKFWGRFADFGNPDGGHKQFDTDTTLTLIPLGSFLLNFIADDGRGTYALWNFDPCPRKPGLADPIPSAYPYTAQGSFRDIQKGDELLALNGYVLDRKRATGSYRLWSVDPQAIVPLTYPAIQQGTWADIGPDHELVPVGDFVLDWVPANRSYRLWRFDPKQANPLTGPVRSGVLPESFAADASLMGFQPNAPVDQDRVAVPGTIDFMRSKIKHVVYYMLENRSFDHVCGWLYEQGEQGIRFVGLDGPFKGASTEYFNDDGEGKRVTLSKYRGGVLSTEWNLEMFNYDPYHDLSDVLRQMFHANRDGYTERKVPDMGGFVFNNGNPQVMQTYTPEQLPVLNGLAREYAISDEWFSSMPAATDVNRSFALTGSAQQQLNNFMSPPQYLYWPEQPHRASIWKVLWANGITDWKLYNSIKWQAHPFTYQLFLEGQIPTVDAEVTAGGQDHIAPIDQFFADAAAGKLPAFSYLEPVWIGNTGTTSYHPGEDLVPGEEQLNRIYDALRNGPNWEETLLIVTFDEHGGIFDHVPPPAAENPWPNDRLDGFGCDVMGVRVPAIVVSPWIEAKTVFRSNTGVAFDHTSILATLLQWCGIPKSRWFLGERTNHAPTFENVFTRAQPRTDAPAFKPPYDKNYPPDGPRTPTTNVHGLHLNVAHQLVASMARGKLPAAEISRLSHELAAGATDSVTLVTQLDRLADKFSGGA
jgi:phospholipase C